MKALFRSMSWTLSLAVILMIVSPTLAQDRPDLSQFVQASQKRRTRPSRGFPGNRTERASRGCATANSMIAIAPEWTDLSTARKNVWGKTTAAHPTLWFFVPFTTSSTQLEFSLQSQDDNDVYRTMLPVPSKPGIVAIQLPKTIPALQINQPYRWTLKAIVPCPSDEPEQAFVQGWIQRVEAPELPGDDAMKALQYAEADIWYDAVTAIATLMQRSPKDLNLKQTWSELLQSEQLEALIEQPIYKRVN